MNKNSNMPIGDLSGRETELGVPTPKMVEQRAREIAKLNQRNPDQFTAEDWEQARAELTGTPMERPPNDPGLSAASQSERGSVPGESGRKTPRVASKDEEILAERITERGVEEAAHDQRVASYKLDQNQTDKA